ncbi:FAD-dependent oxidoreductase [Flagellimonas sp. DF-77]|uniref:NAD(P)/FAD-dependent oxidoreductase n=1 Tax=Flagellimonas algarum TaxID=3230298 RepID=UPI003396C04A
MGKQLLIIGGGIVGLSTAYYAHKAGHEVTLIEKSNGSHGASHVNAGYLTPSHIIPLAAPGMINQGLRYMFDSSSPFYMKPRLDAEFLKWAWYFKKSATKSKVEKAIPVIKDINILSRELFMGIKDSGELGDFHLERKGLLMLYKTGKARDHELEVARKARFLGLEVNELDATALRAMEPGVAQDVKGAIHYECDGHMSPNQFMDKMRTYLNSEGIAMNYDEEVIDLLKDSNRVVEVATTKNRYRPDAVVMASGVWSTKVLKQLGVRLPLEAGKGYRINVERETDIRMPAILMEAKMAVTPMQGFTRFAGTMEFSGINHHIRQERVDAIARGAEKYYCNLEISESDKAKAACGLRPVSPDGLPYIGRPVHFENLFIAAGHAMMGWSLGPATGKLIAELLSGKATSMDLTPFSPNRRF